MSEFFNPFVGGEGSSEDEVARAEIAAIKDGEILDSFGDVETALAEKADIADIPIVPITTIQKNSIDIIPVDGTVNITVPTTAADVSALPDITKYAAVLSLTIDSSTFVMTGQLKDQNGDNLGTVQTIDLPLESVVVNGSYDSQTKKVILTLQNGNTVEFSVADLVAGLQTELSAINKLNPTYINYDSTHAAVTEVQRTQIGTNQAAIEGQQNTTVSGGNGYAIINGQRLYMSNTAPTGIIPVGSALVSNSKVWGYKASTVVNPTILSDGTAISDYNIKGNTKQNGTPTPSNPIDVVGVGILGKNLYNMSAGAYQTGVRYNSSGEVESNANYSIWSIGVSALSSGTYTFSLDSVSTSTTTLRVVGFKNDVKVEIIGATQMSNMPLSITVTDAYDEIRFSAANSYAERIMLNSGSAPLPYEPFGYYLPVSNSGVVTNIPIGTVQTTRVIKKLVLDGTENWGKSGSGDTAYFSLNVGDSRGSNCYCSHFVYTSITSENTDIGIRLSGDSQNIRIRPIDVANTDETAFKTWLSTQYTNGTPVTVLYLRKDATDIISNEPLYSISTSYDNLYYTQSQVSIPTTAGENSITFLTDIQPSRFTITAWVEDVLTPEQEVALNSGITSVDVTQIEINKNNIADIKDGTNINSFSDIEIALNGKVDKEIGKGLSTNDYTTEEKTKLAGIAEGAEVNVQSDWNQNDNSKDDYIKNKPTIPTTATQISYDNTISHLEATNTQAAIDELATISYPSINIIADNGAVITATNGAITLTATMKQSPLKMLIPSYGKWTFSASLSGKTISKIINFTASKIYNVELTFDNVYGVEWGLTGQTLSRTGAAAQFINPISYVNNGMSAEDCSSPFDNLYPWNGMIRETIDGNEVVKIPKFWYKIEKTSSKLSIQIADAPRDGFNVSPAHRARGSYPEQDYVYIGRYHSNSNYKSTSGVIPVVNITRATARTNQAAIGSGYYQLDFSLWVTIWMLYLVEFANWNTQSMIGYNCGNNSSKENTGSTDTMPYHTGTMQISKTTYGVGVQYRYIEDPWGNVLDWCDGITFGPDENNNAGEGIYCFEDFADYSDSYNSANAVLVGRRANVSNYIQDFDQSNINGFDWVLYPGNGDTGNSQNQVPDYCYFNASGVVLCVGGGYYQYAGRGLFYLSGGNSASYQNGYIGVRLQKIPSIN